MANKKDLPLINQITNLCGRGCDLSERIVAIVRKYDKQAHEAELQEKLRQQREACLEAYSAKYLELFDRLPADNDYLSRGILNATIDNNGEEG